MMQCIYVCTDQKCVLLGPFFPYGFENQHGDKGYAEAEGKMKRKQAAEDQSIRKLMDQWLNILPSSGQAPILPEIQALIGGPFSRSASITTPLARLLRLLLLNDSFLDMAKRREVSPTNLLVVDEEPRVFIR